MRIKFVILSIILFGMCCACSEKSHFDEPRPEITVVLGLSGAGDNGYNDEILAGIMDVNETNEVSLSMISPASMDDARSALSTWLNKELSGVNALLVLAGNEYGGKVKEGTLLELQWMSGADGNFIVAGSKIVERKALKDISYIQIIDGKISKRETNQFAFIKKGNVQCYIRPETVQKQQLKDNDNVSVLAVLDYNKKKECWNWTCVFLIKK